MEFLILMQLVDFYSTVLESSTFLSEAIFGNEHNSTYSIAFHINCVP